MFAIGFRPVIVGLTGDRTVKLESYCVAPIRISVVGAGLIGRKHIEILLAKNADYTLAAIADPSPGAAADAQLLGYPCFVEIEEMLEHAKPDGVIIAVPNQLHLATGLACITRGIPILVEKPIADTVEAALELVEAAERENVPILVGHHRRHNPIMRKATELIRNGGVGKVVAVTGFWLGQKPREYFDVTWRHEVGGGPILINAIHDIDCLRMLCGDVDTVQASLSNAVRGYEVEDTAAAVLRFKNGALGTLIVSDTVSTPWTWEWTSQENPFYPHEPENCYLVAGTKGSLAVPSLEHRWHKTGSASWGTPLEHAIVPVEKTDPFHEQMLNFVGVIRGTEMPVLNGMDGTRTLATTLAIVASAKTGKTVNVDDILGPKAK